jgi:histidinol-phosphatase
MAGFRSALAVERKPDGSPVTEADRAVERELRNLIEAARPEDGLVGEEYGSEGGRERRWFLDPIDGTKNFVRGIPVFATLIALEVEGRIEVGVVSAPALGARWWAVRGGGAHASGRPVRVSAVASLEQAQLAYDSVPGFAVRGLEERFLGLALGDEHVRPEVAEGCVEIAVEPEVSPWDLAPLLLIVEEAGGRFTDLEGRPRIDGGSAVASNGLLHDQVLEALREPC